MLSDGSPSSDADRERRRAELRRRYRAAATKALDAFLTELYGPDDTVYPEVPATSFVRCDVFSALPCTPKREQCQQYCIRNGASPVQHNRHYGAPVWCENPAHGDAPHADSSTCLHPHYTGEAPK